MPATPSSPPQPADAPMSMRERTALVLRAEVTAVALELFLEQGFEKTTVDQIATRSGLSRTSFFRYFPAKEDVALGNLDEHGRQVADALAESPADESTWAALGHALSMTFQDTGLMPADRTRRLKLARMVGSTPSLMSRYLQKRQHWHALLIPQIAARMGVADPARDPLPDALLSAAFACYDAAVVAWTNSDGVTELAELLTTAMAGLSTAVSAAS